MLHLAQQLWSGKKTVKPHWSKCSDAFLAFQSWTGQLGVANRICKDAFDWQTKGRAGDRPGLSKGGAGAKFSAQGT